MKGSDSKYQTLNKFDIYMSFLFLNEKCTSQLAPNCSKNSQPYKKVLKQNNKNKIFCLAVKQKFVLVETICRCSKKIFKNITQSRLQIFFKIDVFKNFAIFTGKRLCWRLQHRSFPVNIAKFLRTAFLKKIPMTDFDDICVKDS